MKILGIETSCDETASAVVEMCPGTSKIQILSNIVSSQIEIHKKYGGVVPEVAAREHVLNILPVVHEALAQAGVNPLACPPSWRDKGPVSPELQRGAGLGEIDAIAVTIGPGLITSLIVGVETAKTLAYTWNIPVIGINHIKGHIYANFININPNDQIPMTKPQIPKLFPALILTVSGGHTMLVLMRGHNKFEIIGDTRDDAAGEAFDKAAQLLGLGYPGGPAIANLASQISHRKSNAQNARNINSDTRYAIRDTRYAIRDTRYAIRLPRPMIKDNNFEFSFSGLKTALLYQIKKDPDWKKRKAEYAAEFQQAVIDVLISKTIKAAKKFNVKTVMLSGGVSANTELRNQMAEAVSKLPDINFNMPDLKYCTDNAAMIAAAACYAPLTKKSNIAPLIKGGREVSWQKLKADANAELK